MTDFALSRRGLLGGSVVLVVGGVAGYLVGRDTAAARGVRGTTAANAYGPEGAAPGHALAPVDRVPQGGGLVLDQDRVVLTRSASGDVRAFSAVCTHQGCLVDRVAGGSIDCPCHGSRFDAGTGAVTSGPATRPLAQIAVTVRDGQVYRT